LQAVFFELFFRDLVGLFDFLRGFGPGPVGLAKFHRLLCGLGDRHAVGDGFHVIIRVLNAPHPSNPPPEDLRSAFETGFSIP
jgi:hypothetical protein